MRVRLERDVFETDPYGRLLRYMYADRVFVNAELVRKGLVWAKAYPTDTKYLDYLAELEQQARLAGKGKGIPSTGPTRLLHFMPPTRTTQ